jgi:hypothetical protein
VVERVVERSGGTAVDGVQEETRRLEGADAEEVERWVEEVVMRQKRKDAPTPGSAPSAEAADGAVPSRDRAA